MFVLFIFSFGSLIALQEPISRKGYRFPTRAPSWWVVFIADRGSRYIKADQEVMGPPGGLNVQKAKLWGETWCESFCAQ